MADFGCGYFFNLILMYILFFHNKNFKKSQNIHLIRTYSTSGTYYSLLKNIHLVEIVYIYSGILILKKARFKKESWFKKDCWYIDFLVHKLFDLLKDFLRPNIWFKKEKFLKMLKNKDFLTILEQFLGFSIFFHFLVWKSTNQFIYIS